MTDTTVFFRAVVAQATQFTKALEDLKLLADRIGADSALSGKTATAAQAGGRADLTAADFDNFKIATDLLTSLLNTTAGQSITNQVNTGGKAVLAFYKLL